MEINKILMAFLVAGITAMIAGFISYALVKPEQLAENAYKIDIAAIANTAPAAGNPAAAPAAEKAEPIGNLIAKADIEQGKKVSKTCAACHTFGKGEPNRIGPNLFGVVGRARGSTNFAYSGAMKSIGGSWNEDTLNTFLTDPKKAVPGTKMTFVGLKKPEDRAAIIKWLSALK